MASISLPGMTRWGNPYSRLPGALGPSPSHGGGLGALFFFGHRCWYGGPHEAASVAFSCLPAPSPA